MRKNFELLYGVELKNIPVRTVEEGRRLRDAFHCPPGHVFCEADYAAEEIKVTGSMAPKIDPAEVAKRLGAEITEPKGKMRHWVSMARFWLPSLRKRWPRK
jgi:hypothetical protein